MTKLNLLLDPNKSTLNGYMNICQLQSNDQNKILGNLEDLNDWVDTNECEEVLAFDVINFLPLQLVHKFISHWLTRVAKGGTITVTGLDLKEAARLIFLGRIEDVVSLNRLIYGDMSNTWSIRKSYVPDSDIAGMIVQSGQFDIVTQKYDGPMFIITAKRR